MSGKDEKSEVLAISKESNVNFLLEVILFL